MNVRFLQDVLVGGVLVKKGQIVEADKYESGTIESCLVRGRCVECDPPPKKRGRPPKVQEPDSADTTSEG